MANRSSNSTKRESSRKRELYRLRDKCDAVFSKCVRMSHANEGGMCQCYTCGLLGHWKRIHAGHWISRQFWPTRWHVNNVKPQCYPCNCFSGRSYEKNPDRLAFAEKYKSRFIGGGERMVFENHLLADGVDVEELRRLSEAKRQTKDELEDLYDYLSECWEALCEKKVFLL